MAQSPSFWHPDDRTLRQFSEAALYALGLVACPLALWRGHPRLAAVYWGAAVTVRLVGWARPGALRPLYRASMAVSRPVGWLIAHVAMAILYFVVFAPVAALFRLIGRDALQRRFDRDAVTYWEAHGPDDGPERSLRTY